MNLPDWFQLFFGDVGGSDGEKSFYNNSDALLAFVSFYDSFYPGKRSVSYSYKLSLLEFLDHKRFQQFVFCLGSTNLHERNHLPLWDDKQFFCLIVMLELNRQRQSPRRYEYSTPKPFKEYYPLWQRGCV